MDQKKIKKISRYGKFLLQATKVALNCLPMQNFCEIYYMCKQLTLAEKALGAFPADAFRLEPRDECRPLSLLSASIQK